MNILMLLQASQRVAEKSTDMMVKDPHGAIITLVSVTVVFVALVILYFAYTFIGKISSGEINWKKASKASSRKSDRTRPSAKTASPAGEKESEEIAAAIAMALDHEMNGEVYAAISMALHQYLNDTVHDMESYIITIKRK